MASLTTYKVNLADDHLKRVSKTSAIPAIEELIWNSLDADACNISLRINSNPLGGNVSISLEDDGSGVSPREIQNYIASLGNSWKTKIHETPTGRPIHGQKGEGRFKAFSLGRVIDWESTYKDKEDLYKINIHFKSDDIKRYQVSQPEINNQKQTGLKVTISELEKPIASNPFADINQKLIQTFGVYLYNYPNVVINVNGFPLNVKEAIINVHEFPLELEGITGIHKLKIIEWATIHTKQLMLLGLTHYPNKT